MENNPKYIIRLNQKAGELFIESLTNISSNEEVIIIFLLIKTNKKDT